MDEPQFDGVGGKYSSVGSLSGIKIISESGLRRMQRRWKKSAHQRNEQPLRASKTEKKDLLSCAKRFALRMRHSGQLKIQEGREDFEGEEVERKNLSLPVSFSPGWARRSKHERLYGRKHIEKYRTDVAEMFRKGANVSSEKVSAPAMWEALLLKYPERYDLPSEQEIRQEISRLSRLQERGVDVSSPVPQRRGRKGMDSENEVVLVNMIKEFPAIKPREGYKMFVDQFKDHDVEKLPTEKQVKSKISSLKHAAKREERDLRAAAEKSM